MRVLGIDPGIATVGFGVIESDGFRQSMICCGVITTPASMPLPERLSRIYEDARELIREHKPETAAIEELFFNTNVKTALAVAQGRGVLLLACQNEYLPVYEYTPLQVKQAVAGYGRAGKKQVMAMVSRLLALKAAPKPDDAADALAIALCHARSAMSLINSNI